LRRDAPQVVGRYAPEYGAEYARRGWTMTPSIDRVYVNDKARADLGWQPRHDFRTLVARAQGGRRHPQPTRARGRQQGLSRSRLPAPGLIRWSEVPREATMDESGQMR